MSYVNWQHKALCQERRNAIAKHEVVPTGNIGEANGRNEICLAQRQFVAGKMRSYRANFGVRYFLSLLPKGHNLFDSDAVRLTTI
jgi:hypothetical protein